MVRMCIGDDDPDVRAYCVRVPIEPFAQMCSDV